MNNSIAKTATTLAVGRFSLGWSFSLKFTSSFMWKPTQTRELMNNGTLASYVQYHITDTVNVKDALDFSKNNQPLLIPSHSRRCHIRDTDAFWCQRGFNATCAKPNQHHFCSEMIILHKSTIQILLLNGKKAIGKRFRHSELHREWINMATGK